MRTLLLLLFVLLVTPASGQSLYLNTGERAVEAWAGLSVGPTSHGEEASVAVGFGRFDVGLDVGRYTYAYDGSETTYNEFAPFVRAFLFKQQSGAPVSVALTGQVFFDDYPTDEEGGYLQVGPTVYRLLELSERFALQPFVSFAFVAETYTPEGGEAETDQYLTRDLGVHFSTATTRPWVVRVTFLEQSFRQETYRAARLALLRRL